MEIILIQIILIQIIISLLIAFFIGRKRWLGFLWSFLFSMALTPLFGLFVTLDSRRKSTYIIIKPSKLKLVGGILLNILGIGFLLAYLSQDFARQNPILPTIVLLPFVWGTFCIYRSRGINHSIVRGVKTERADNENPAFDSGEYKTQRTDIPKTTTTNFVRRRLSKLKSINKGVYRLTIFLSFAFAIIFAVIVESNADEDGVMFFVMLIPLWFLFWGLIFISLWVYEGFVEHKYDRRSI